MGPGSLGCRSGAPRPRRRDAAARARAQNTAEDWRLGSLGCYDAASLARLQTTLRLDFGAVARGNLEACLARPLDGVIQRALCDETRRACLDALARLMADHTQVLGPGRLRGLHAVRQCAMRQLLMDAAAAAGKAAGLDQLMTASP